MALPKKLKYLNLFNDGNSYLGLVSALTLEWTMGGLDTLVLQQWGAVDATPLRFAGSFQQDDTGETLAVEVVIRWRHKEIDFGEYKQGEDTETKVSTQCTCFKLSINGQRVTGQRKQPAQLCAATAQRAGDTIRNNGAVAMGVGSAALYAEGKFIVPGINFDKEMSGTQAILGLDKTDKIRSRSPGRRYLPEPAGSNGWRQSGGRKSGSVN